MANYELHNQLENQVTDILHSEMNNNEIKTNTLKHVFCPFMFFLKPVKLYDSILRMAT